jgi:hypothetical protein
MLRAEALLLLALGLPALGPATRAVTRVAALWRPALLKDVRLELADVLWLV